MSPASSQLRDIHSGDDDELDDILKGIAEGRDLLDPNHIQTQADSTRKRKTNTTGGLGIDEEIVITNKRQPAPKLDDERLLSAPGIPRLRKISKERLRFKGKGHEYGDIARMLNMYQFWLDDLYPRAKFADALALVEKVGHTKRMQAMRKDWIEEGKPRRTVEQEDKVNEITADDAQAEHPTEAMEGVIVRLDKDRSPSVLKKQEGTLAPKDRILDKAGHDDPDDDELDALLAESAPFDTITPKALPSRTIPAEDDPYADEMEAMADMDDLWD